MTEQDGSVSGALGKISAGRGFESWQHNLNLFFGVKKCPKIMSKFSSFIDYHLNEEVT